MSVLNTPVISASYSDSFWDDQHKGYDILSNRLRKSRETSEEIKKLYQTRAQIEQEYGDKLLKLSQDTNFAQYEEQDSFAETLGRVSTTLETAARAHIDLAQKFKDHLELPLDGFIKEQREIRKSQQQQVESTKQLKNLHEMDVTRAREDYANECSKLISMEQRFKNEQDSNMEQLLREIEEQRRVVVIAEQVYRRSVDSLNNVNEKWIKDWTAATSVFQDLEVSRIKYLINTFWTFSNMMKNTFGIDEDCCDQINTYLGTTDVNQDMMEFVKRYGTGTKLPVPVPYETLYTPPLQPLVITQEQQQSILPMEIQQQQQSNNHEERSPVTVLTNPDEELKSVEQQLQRLEEVHALPEHISPTSPTKNQLNTSSRNSREIPQNRPNYDDNNDSLPIKLHEEDMLEKKQQQQQQQQQQRERESTKISEQPPKVELAPLTPPLLSADPIHKSGSSISLKSLEKSNKYRPMPNPVFKNSTTQSSVPVKTTNDTSSGDEIIPGTVPNKRSSVVVNARTSSLASPTVTGVSSKRHTLQLSLDDDEDGEENEANGRGITNSNGYPKTPPKDEKWVISSIRQHQQLPVKSSHAKVFDSSSINSRNSLPLSFTTSDISAINNLDEKQHYQQQQQQDEQEINQTSGIQQYKAKMRRPSIPLTIDIPNNNNNNISENNYRSSSDSNARELAHQAIAQAKRQSQMSPVNQNAESYKLLHQEQQQQQNRNIRHGSYIQSEDNNKNDPYNNYRSIGSYQQQVPRPRDSSLASYKYSPQEQQHNYYSPEDDGNKKRTSSTQLPILNKLKSGSSDKPKDSNKTTRFSIPFFGGTKKDKKKEKEPANNIQQQASGPQQLPFNGDHYEKRHSGYHYQQQMPVQQSILYQQQQQQQQQKENVPELIAANRSNPQLAPNQPRKSTGSEHKEYIGYARAMWPFEATIKEEMSFQQGDIVGIIHKQEDGWWVAELIKSQKPTQQGLVPGNYMADLQQ